jgi:hypothetical protein
VSFNSGAGQAGIHVDLPWIERKTKWIPAFAGMTPDFFDSTQVR